MCFSDSSEYSKATNPSKSKELLTNVANKASFLKFDFAIAKSHFIQQFRQTGIHIFMVVMKN